MTNWKEIDHRHSSMDITLKSLQLAIDEISKFQKGVIWFDGLFLLEAIEPIYGTAFVVMQNYINSSIYDRYDTLDNKHVLYKNGKSLEGIELTYVELIVAIANYFKHRDDERGLHRGTKNVLNLLGLNDLEDIEESPILKSMDIVDPNWRISTFDIILTTWRKSLWEN